MTNTLLTKLCKVAKHLNEVYTELEQLPHKGDVAEEVFCQEGRGYVFHNQRGRFFCTEFTAEDGTVYELNIAKKDVLGEGRR